MNALIKISGAEFNEDLFEKISSLIASVGNAEITISVTDVASKPLRKESKEAYWERLGKSVVDIREGKGTIFTMDELGSLLHNAAHK